NDIVGDGISGVLNKWVNYGKGWRPRWFVLQDGVLSYYKIHGPHKIVVSKETEKGARVIGDESFRRLSRHRGSGVNGIGNNNNNSSSSHRPYRKPVGEVHLKVSSVRESRSDDRRFSIFTGTKRLHLRADTRDDRIAWMEALQAVKGMFPRMSNSELMAPIGGVTLSTEKLRQRLLEEGVSEAAIQDSETIMMTEFSAMQDQLVLLKQKHLLLMDTLRMLETEKVDLENTVVDESQRLSKEVGATSRFRQEKYSDASPSESEDDNDRGDAAEEESDDEDNAFFDTRDFLSSGSFKSSGSDMRSSSFTSDDEDSQFNEPEIDASIRSVGTSFPRVKRRKKLPDPVEKEKGGNSLMRILNVAAFAVSGYSSTEERSCKPFNPLLGETYEADYPDKGLRFFSEKVSHHPMIVACHCEGKGWKFWGDSNLKSKFWGRSIQLDPVGVLTLEFDDGEIFQWSKVTTSIYNLILGKLYCDHYGTMRIQGNQNYSCKLKFKEQSIIERNPH
ncbi:hypothetical protein M8C21_023608, partial [Ambrosia artemisiifolia]